MSDVMDLAVKADLAAKAVLDKAGMEHPEYKLDVKISAVMVDDSVEIHVTSFKDLVEQLNGFRSKE